MPFPLVFRSFFPATLTPPCEGDDDEDEDDVEDEDGGDDSGHYDNGGDDYGGDDHLPPSERRSRPPALRLANQFPWPESIPW